MPDEIVFDGRGFEELGRDLRLAAGLYRREMTTTLAEAGKLVEETAKGVAARHSQSEPPTIRSRVIPGAAVIAAGGAASPIAALDELGNKRSKRSARTFRHPVFGNRNAWVEQEKHPFLAPALRANRPAIRKLMEDRWERIVRMIERGERV